MRELGEILDDEGAGGARGVVAANQEAEDLIGDVQLGHVNAIVGAREEHVGQDVLRRRRLTLRQVDLPLLDDLQQLLPDEVGRPDRPVERSPRQVDGHGYDPGRQALERLLELFNLARLLQVHEQPRCQPERIPVCSHMKWTTTCIIYHASIRLLFHILPYLAYTCLHITKKII